MPKHVEFENGFCPLMCNNSNDKSVLTGRDRLHDLPGEFKVLVCNTCGLMRTHPRPTPGTIRHYYPSDYAPYLPAKIARQHGNLRALLADNGTARWVVSRLVGRTRPWVPDLRPGARVLEIGFGNGDYCRELLAHGWEVHGVEFDAGMVDHAKNLGVLAYCGTVEQARYPEASFDAVIGWHVFEHLYDPLGTAKEVFRILKPGGIFVVGVPNAGSVERRIFGRNWYALELPRHLFHFAPGTLRTLFEVAGFRDIKVTQEASVLNVLMSLVMTLESAFHSGRPLHGMRRWVRGSIFLRTITRPLAALLRFVGQSGRMVTRGAR